MVGHFLETAALSVHLLGKEHWTAAETQKGGYKYNAEWKGQLSYERDFPIDEKLKIQGEQNCHICHSNHRLNFWPN